MKPPSAPSMMRLSEAVSKRTMSPSNNTATPHTYLITGASSGIGRGVANALGRERARVALIGRNPERLDRVAREVTMFGGEALTVQSDVRDLVSVQSALATVTARWGRVDTAILSSGIAESVDTEAFRSHDLEEIFATNLFGVTHWLEALHPVMRAQPGGGTIAVVSSLSADRAIPGGGAGYSASKAAVSQLCDGLRAPLKAQGIRLVIVAPGFVRTPMLDGMPWTPASVSPEQSAAFVLNGLRRRHRVIRYPLMASLTMGLIRRLPAAALDLLYRPQR